MKASILLIGLLLLATAVFAAPPTPSDLPFNITGFTLSNVEYGQQAGAYITVVNSTGNGISNAACGWSIYSYTPTKHVIKAHKINPYCEESQAYAITGAGTGDIPTACFIQTQLNGEMYRPFIAGPENGITQPGTYTVEFQCGNTTLLTQSKNFSVTAPALSLDWANTLPQLNQQLDVRLRDKTSSIPYSCDSWLTAGTTFTRDLGSYQVSGSEPFTITTNTLGLELYKNYTLNVNCTNYATYSTTIRVGIAPAIDSFNIAASQLINDGIILLALLVILAMIGGIYLVWRYSA